MLLLNELILIPSLSISYLLLYCNGSQAISNSARISCARYLRRSTDVTRCESVATAEVYNIDEGNIVCMNCGEIVTKPKGSYMLRTFFNHHANTL
jgi:hypothetical protein